MKNLILETGAAIAIVLITGTGAACADTGDSQDSTMQKIEHGSAHVAKATMHDTRMLAHDTVHGGKGIAASAWDESKRIGRTVVDSPVIAYEVVRGERPLFPQKTESREESRREQVALTGHRTKSRTEMNDSSRHNEPPI